MIIIVFGLPGTGKSYFSTHLSKELGAVYLGTDEVRFQLQGRGRYDADAKQAVYEELEELMAEHASKGETVVVDGTFHQSKRRERFRKRAEALRQPFFFIEITADEAKVKQRVERKRQGSEADYEVFKVIRSLFEPLEEDHLQLRSDLDDLETMTAKAKRYLNG